MQSGDEVLGGSALGATGRLLAELLLGESSSVGVEAEHDLLVAEGVLLLDGDALGAGLALGGAEHGLHLGGVDQTADVGVGDQVGGQVEVLLEGGRGGGGAVDLVEGLEGGGGPDDEAAEVATGGELEQVQGEDVAGLNTGDVAEGADELLAVGLGVVDDQGAAALAVAAVTQLTLTGAGLLGLVDLDQLGAGAKGLQESDGGPGLGEGGTLEGLGLNDQGDLGDVGDAVTAGEQERGDGRSGQSGGGSKASVFQSISSITLTFSFSEMDIPLVHVDLLVPLAPHLGGSEHATGTALVTEGSLTGTVSTTTGDTGDTSDSAT